MKGRRVEGGKKDKGGKKRKGGEGEGKESSGRDGKEEKEERGYVPTSLPTITIEVCNDVIRFTITIPAPQKTKTYQVNLIIASLW